jgi:xylulose-5-phosphate/fructose-6-phosphate phosphoketolase
MIFLKDNVLLDRDLEASDIKPRLLGTQKCLDPYDARTSSHKSRTGHWGTCPGLNLIHAHANLLIQKYDLDMIYLIGPGHGAPAALACAWLDGSLERFYPQFSKNATGLHNLISGFSTPGGFPRHGSDIFSHSE